MQQQRRKSRDAARGKQEHGGDEWPKTHNITELTLAARRCALAPATDMDRKAAAVDETDRRTDIRPLHRRCTACWAGSVRKLEVGGRPVGNACTLACTYARTNAQTDGQPEHIMPPRPHLSEGRRHHRISVQR